MDCVPEEYEVAKLNGFDILIRPLANLIRSDQHCVFGIVATTTHEELGRLYDYAQNDLQEALTSDHHFEQAGFNRLLK